MPISATGISARFPRRASLLVADPTMIARSKSAGFSLLELLVVVFIVGILAAMFTLSVGITGGDREMERETDRLEALLRLAAEEATLQGREIGMRFFVDGYEFATYVEDFVDYRDPDDESEEFSETGWTLLTNTDWFDARRLPDGLILEIEIDGRSVVLDGTDDEDEDEDDDYEPQVIIFSSGDVTPFIIRLRRSFENTGVTIDIKEDGSVELNRGV
jgi:general secretion pathway protein H